MSRGVSIQQLSPDDVDDLAPLWAALVQHHAAIWSVLPARSLDDSWARRRRQYEAWLAGGGSFVLVARRDSALIGYVMVAVAEGDETFLTGDRLAEVETLVVVPEARGDGVGGLLLDAAVTELARLGIDDVLVGTMAANAAALRFYRSRGFAPFVHLLYARRTDVESTAEEQP